MLRRKRCASRRRSGVKPVPRNSSRLVRALILASLVGAVGLTSGCAVRPWSATPFRAPADVAHIKLTQRDSPSIVADKLWLERRGGTLFLSGYVMAKVGVTDTMGSQVVVSVRDASGNELRSMPVDFHPRQIPQQRRPAGVSRYSVQLDPLPPQTAEIVVRASDDRISTTVIPPR